MGSEAGIRIAVCDDQASDRKVIVDLVQAYAQKNRMEVKIDEFESGDVFLSADTSVYNLVFFDIFMDGTNGMETAKILFSRNSRSQIVFCSTSAEFAAESYDVAALYYLVKPVNPTQFMEVMERFFGVYRSLRTITIKVQKEDITLYLADILWAEVADHKCVLHTKVGEFETRMPFSQLCSELLPFDFVQPIRYAVVSLKEIIKVPSDTVTLSDGSVIPVSRGARLTVKQAFSDYKWRVMSGRAGER